MPTSTTKPSVSFHTITLSPNPATPLIAARSAITLYPTADVPFPPSRDSNSPTPSPSSTSSNSIPPTAFWAVLACLIALFLLFAIAFPLWYFLRHRRHQAKTPPTPTISVTPPEGSPSQHQRQHQHQQQQTTQSPQWWGPTPLSTQQFQLLQAIGAAHSVPPTPTPPQQQQHPANNTNLDPNTTTLLSRLRQLNNPSILGAIPESTVMTSSSSMRPHQLNEYYRSVAEKRLAEARARGEVNEKEAHDDDDDGGANVGKRVRWREREWAVLGSDVESGEGEGR